MELNIGDAEVAAKVYAGGYLYGNGADSAEAQMTVDEVNITIDGGAVSSNLYGGAHAREYGYALVDTVNITVTDGSHGRIYAGGWAEKGAVSSVGISNVIISGGTVDYLYGGGANADGTTTVHLTVAEAEYYCGQYVKNLNISTGRVYPNVLTLDIDCVYQKPGEPETYYVREVTRQGAFVAEHKVTVSYRSATFVSIAGVEEGKYYDSGYKAVIEGGA